MNRGLPDSIDTAIILPEEDLEPLDESLEEIDVSDSDTSYAR